VTNILVNSSTITLATANADENVTWIGNGGVVGTGMSLSLLNLPPDLLYVRAEIVDPEGRLIYTQPFAILLPEPNSVAMLGSGIAMVWALQRRRRT